jgi:hypothetical protein
LLRAAFTALNPVWAGAHDLEVEFEVEVEFEFKEVSAVFKMSPASRWRDNSFTVGSNPQPGSPQG